MVKSKQAARRGTASSSLQRVRAEPEDPIAAALAARQRRQAELVKEAAEAAAKNASADVTTVFGVSPAKSAPPDAGASDTHPRQLVSGVARAGSPLEAPSTGGEGSFLSVAVPTSDHTTASGEPKSALSSLLGYSNESPRSDTVSDGGEAEGNSSPYMSSKDSGLGLPATSPSGVPGEGTHGMDDEVANFLGELEASGLLAGNATEPAQTGQPSTFPEASLAVAAPSQAAAALNAAGEPAAPAVAETGALPSNGKQSRQQQESASIGSAAAAAKRREPAEQRVLGKLQGAPDWFEVMDMASGKVYFWNGSSNEVAWQPPADSAPRSSHDTAAIYADAQAGSKLHHSKQEIEPGHTPLPASKQDSAPPQQHAEATQLARDEAVTLHQLEVLALLLEQEAPSHSIPLLARLSVQAAALRDTQQAVSLMARADGDRLVLSRAAFDAWVHQQYTAIHAEADQVSAAATAEHHTSPTRSPELPAAASAEQPEDGELPAEPAGSPHDTDMEIESEAEQGQLPYAGLPADDIRRTPHDDNGSSEDPPLPPEDAAGMSAQADLDQEAVAPPLPAAHAAGDGTTDANGPSSAAAEYLAAALTPESNPPTPSAQVVKRREYAAQPVRSYTPPGVSSDAAPLPTQSIAQATADAKRKLDRGPVVPGKKRKSSKVPKMASALFDKWQAVRKDMEAEAEEEDANMDPEALERERLRKAEEWRVQQLREGTTAEQNANFQPLATDWRQRVKAVREAQAGSPESSRASIPSPPVPPPGDGRPDLAALGAGLPEGWKAMWDKSSKEVYYGNLTTKETSWDRPA